MARTVNLGQIVPNIQIGETTTTSPSSSASVVNVGTELNPILNFSIPKGDTGATGPTGDTGANGLDAKINGVNTLTIEAGTNITLDQEGNTLTISSTGGGGGGTSNYNALTNKPKINNVELNGNKTLNDLGIQAKGNYALKSEIPTKTSDLTNDSGFITEYTETDPTVPSHVKNITQANITSWNNKLDSSKVKNANSTTAGDVYDVRYINNMIGDVETILTRLTTGSGV